MNTTALKMTSFNQIKYVEQLQEAGLREAQAKAIVTMMTEAQNFNTENLVTKEYLDVKITKLELKIARQFNTLLCGLVITVLAPLVFHHLGLL